MKKSKKSAQLSIVVPVFNNQETLRSLYEELDECFSRDYVDAEIVFVNDGSTDDSLRVLKEILDFSKLRRSIRVRIVEMVSNCGQQKAMFAGISHSKGSIFASISADLQDPPSVLKEMYDKLIDDVDFVIGVRNSRKDGYIQRIGSRITYFFLSRLDNKIPHQGFDMWIAKRELVLGMLNKKHIVPLSQFYLMRMGVKPLAITYARRERSLGISGYSFKKKLSMAIDVFLVSMIAFAKVTSSVSLFLVAFSIILLALILVGYVSGQSPFQGFALITGLIILFGSTTILILGSMFHLLFQYVMSDKPLESFLVRELHE